jgi:hypothetical protein
MKPSSSSLTTSRSDTVVQAHEGLGDDLGQARVHREALARPVRRRAEAAHLAGDGVAGVFLPLPDFFEELLAAEVMARNALSIELAFDDDLRRNPGVVGAGLPQRVVAAHAVVARQRIHDRLIEAVPHVQRAGHVRRRQQDAESVGFVRVEAGGEIALGLPVGVPATFDVGRLKALGEFHRIGCATVAEIVFVRKRAIIPDGVHRSRDWRSLLFGKLSASCWRGR